MAISVRSQSDPEVEVEAKMLKSLDHALEQRMSILFADLCCAVSTDAPTALNEFAEGVDAARKAYLDARTIIEAEGKL